MRENRRFRPLMFSRATEQRFRVEGREEWWWPSRSMVDWAERQEREIDGMVRQLTRQANGATETFFFCGSAKHMDWLRERKPFEFRGSFGNWVGSGVPLSSEPDTPFLPDATHEARILFPAGTMPLQARQLMLPGGMAWILKTGATLFAEGVIVKEIRELHPKVRK